MTVTLCDLPNEIIESILGYVPDPTALSQSCRAFRDAVPDLFARATADENRCSARALDRFVLGGGRDRRILKALLRAPNGLIGQTSLLYAIEKDDIALVRCLLDAGAPVNVESEFEGDVWPFSVSVLGRALGRPRIMDMLVRTGARLQGLAVPVTLTRLAREGRWDELRIVRSAAGPGSSQASAASLQRYLMRVEGLSRRTTM
jgi:hypothetical protein